MSNATRGRIAELLVAHALGVDGGLRNEWDADSSTFASRDNRRRQADAHVFALLAHRTKETLNPLDVSQWAFLLLNTSS